MAVSLATHKHTHTHYLARASASCWSVSLATHTFTHTHTLHAQTHYLASASASCWSSRLAVFLATHTHITWQALLPAVPGWRFPWLHTHTHIHTHTLPGQSFSQLLVLQTGVILGYTHTHVHTHTHKHAQKHYLARASASCWSSRLAVSLAEALMASSSVTWLDSLKQEQLPIHTQVTEI